MSRLLETADETLLLFSQTANLDGFDVKVESEHLSKLAESKEELISKVSMLKKDLLEWRTKLDGQVKTFRGVRRHGSDSDSPHACLTIPLVGNNRPETNAHIRD